MADTELDQWVHLSRTVTDDDRERVAPPADLFAKIEAAVRDDAPTTNREPDEAPIATSTSPEPALHVVEDAPSASADPTIVDLETARSRRAPQVRRRDRRRLAIGGLAAALAAVIGFTIIDTGETSDVFVAEATNDSLDEPFDGMATATVDGDDTQRLTFEFSGPLPDSDPIEVWLIRPDLSDMVSLGLVDDPSAPFLVPAGIDVTEFSIVDLSIEPDDGDPTHSGRSILRGALRSI